MQYRVETFNLPAVDPAIMEALRAVDMTEALMDFPHSGFCQDDTGEWCQVGRGKRVRLGLYGDQGIAKLRDRAEWVALATVAGK